jgi:hypothetical protein
VLQGAVKDTNDIQECFYLYLNEDIEDDIVPRASFIQNSF